MIKDCITSLRESETNVEFNCILIESYQQTFDLGQDVTIKYDQPKFNYHHAINQGLDALTSDWVVMANNDLIFSKGWFTEILKIKTQHPYYQSFSPWEPSFCMDGDSQEYYEGYRVGQDITGWCIVCNTEIFGNVTLSEEVDYWFSDNNYADELERNGIRHALVKNSVVKHLCQQTTLRLPNWREMTVEQTAKYEKIKYKKDEQKEV
jgi:GT2 family glycosyltransferase